MDRQGSLLDLARTHPNREHIARLLYCFNQRCADSSPPGLERVATTTEIWWPQVVAFLHTGITNAGSESTNHVIKTVARNAYGFRNPGDQHLHTRAATTPDISTPINLEEPDYGDAAHP